jgi:ABC-type transporter Mla subunit MlaD
MSLGPPFDDSGERLQQAVGAVVVLLLAAAVAWVLTLSGRTIGRGLTVHVDMKTPGLLRVGAKVRLAGREVGEVRGMQMHDRRVDAEVFLLRSDAQQVRKNSQMFVNTPSVLGEAYLEVGPAAAHAEPGPPVGDGDRLHGIDPPEIDDLLAHSETNLRLILALLRENRPEMEELLRAGDSLLATLSGLPADDGQLHRIGEQFTALVDNGASLVHVVREAGGIDRVRKLAREISAIAEKAAPELRRLGTRLDTAMERLDQLAVLFSPERRAQLQAALADFRHAVAVGERIVKDANALARYVADGRGSVGAFLADKELFDDLHETHRILKSQPLRLLLKQQIDDSKKRR